jgi:hypothetical protein
MLSLASDVRVITIQSCSDLKLFQPADYTRPRDNWQSSAWLIDNHSVITDNAG